MSINQWVEEEEKETVDALIVINKQVHEGEHCLEFPKATDELLGSSKTVLRLDEGVFRSDLLCGA